MSNDLDRLKRLVGSQANVARALGMTPEHVSRIANGKKASPDYLAAIAELLESLPPKDWPDRWRGE